MKRREVKDDVKRAAELAAYFTHAKLEPYHTALALRSAMLIFAKLKNYNSCATFCRRMLELNSTQKVCNSHLSTYYACHCHPILSIITRCLLLFLSTETWIA